MSPPNVYEKRDGTKCPAGDHVISRMISIQKSLQKVRCIEMFILLVQCARGQVLLSSDKSYEGVCSCNKATSAALLRTGMLLKWTYVFL